MNLAGAFEGPKRLKLEHRGLRDEVRAKPGRYMGFIAGHGKESGFCSKCSEGHLDIKRGRTMRSMLPFKEIALNPATLCLDSYVCTSAPPGGSREHPPHAASYLSVSPPPCKLLLDLSTFLSGAPRVRPSLCPVNTPMPAGPSIKGRLNHLSCSRTFNSSPGPRKPNCNSLTLH